MQPRTKTLVLILAVTFCSVPTLSFGGEYVGHKVASQGIPEKLCRSFEAFAKTWMEKLGKIERQNVARIDIYKEGDKYSGEYLGYGKHYKFWIKKTNSSKTPYIGFISYLQHRIRKEGNSLKELMICPGKIQTNCKVTEIFPYTNRQWMH